MIRIYFFQKQEKERQTLRFGNWLLKPKKDADCCTITDDALSEKREKKQVFEEKIKYKKGKREEKKKKLGISDLSLETRGPFHCA